jgi:diacylglycerol kinase
MTKKKLSQSIMIALGGIAYGVSNERNIKIQGAIGILVLIISLLLKIPRSDFIIILLVSFLVIICELMNTALERLIDHLHPHNHDNIGKVKDMIAGAVLLSIILAIIVGLLILWNPLIEFFRTI